MLQCLHQKKDRVMKTVMYNVWNLNFYNFRMKSACLPLIANNSYTKPSHTKCSRYNLWLWHVQLYLRMNLRRCLRVETSSLRLFIVTKEEQSFSKFINAYCNFNNNAQETYWFVSNRWFFLFPCNFFAYFKFHSDWRWVMGKIKQNGLDSWGTAALSWTPDMHMGKRNDKLQ